jgi:hypothetical protein
LVVSISVYPSGFALATTVVPMLPPAPGRFSTTNGWPIPAASFCVMIRAIVSLAPPGA